MSEASVVQDDEHLSQLIIRIAAQDRAAFAELFAIVAPRVKAYLLRAAGRDHALVDELTQEVMLSIWRRAETFDAERKNVFAWIFAIARNCRIDRLRRERTHEIDPTDPLFIPDDPASQDRAIEMRERGNILRRAIQQLPAEQAELIQLAFYEDLAHSSIAEQRRLPLGTVKSRLRLALARLRQNLGDLETP